MVSDSTTDLAQDQLGCFRLDDKVAIVTGGASGIGKATARLFAKLGARVVIADLNAASSEVLATELADYRVLAVETDVSEDASVVRMFARAAQVFGGVDILVNNAAFRPKAPFLSMTVEQWEQMHGVIARGTFLCAREAIKLMKSQGRGGAIVNISSVSAVHPTILNNVHYDSAKAGVDALTRALAYEFAGDKIRVNSIRPGWTATEGSVMLRAAGVTAQGPLSTPARVPLGQRAADPIEMARAILFLASPAASFITGQHLAVDGGFLVS